MMLLPSLILTALTALLPLSSAQEWPRPNPKNITTTNWTFRYSTSNNNNGTDPVAVILKDDMLGFASPLRARFAAFFGPSLTESPEFFGALYYKTDLYKVLDETLPDLNGTKAWAENMRKRADDPGSFHGFRAFYHSSLLSLGFFWSTINEGFTLSPREAPWICFCDSVQPCSPRTSLKEPATTRTDLREMLDAMVAVLQDQASMNEYQKWKYENPWVEQDRELMRVAGYPPSAASDLRGLLVMGQYSVYQLLHRFNNDCPVPAVECGVASNNTCTHRTD